MQQSLATIPSPASPPSGAPQRLDDERKRLLAALLELAALMRRPERSSGERRTTGKRKAETRLALGDAMRKYGLGPRHMSALLSVALYGPLTVTQLAARHHVALKTASLLAVELETAGLLERREDPSDRRRTIVTIAKGKERAVEMGLSNRAAELQRTLDRLTPAQRDGLITGLEVLADEMSRERD